MIPHGDATSGSGSWLPGPYAEDTQCVHAGVTSDPYTGAILTPIYQSTAYVQESIEDYRRRGFSYSRVHNPTVTALERKLTALEGGAGCACFNTGMAAVSTTLTAFLKAGDHAIISDCSYGGTNRTCRVLLTDQGVQFSFVDLSDPTNVTASLRENTRVVWSESPANPTLKLTDLRAVSDICKAKGIVHICDATFATPIICRPIEYGVDIVVHATTKFIDGHNACLGGASIAATTELSERLHLYQDMMGSIMSPQVAFSHLQTVKTLHLRVRCQSENAMKVATFLEGHKNVEKVMYPGLPKFPQRELADRQHRNGLHGGMLAFEVQGGVDAGRKLMNTLPRPWTLAENLGATESLITCPAAMTHAVIPREDRLKVGITDGFIRVSCGIEDAEDLIRALRHALDAL